jgi:hypothetical protein
MIDIIKSCIDTLEQICIEFEDNYGECRIEPSSSISSYTGKLPFYVEIDIRSIIKPNDKNGYGPLPHWFIENCRRIESYMLSEGFKTFTSIRYSLDWENLESIDELAEQESLIYKVRLDFDQI